MGKIYFGLVLTLLVSLLVILAGALLSRRPMTRVTGVDRELLQDLVIEIETLILAWEKEREEGLESLAFQISRPLPEEVEEQLTGFAGVRGAFLYRDGRPGKKWILLGALDSRTPAEVVVEDRKTPLIRERAVVIPKGMFEGVTFGQSGQIDNDEGTFHGWWFSPLQGSVVLFLVENEVMEDVMLAAVRESGREAFSRVQLAGEVMVGSYQGVDVLGEGHAERQAAMETGRGDISVRAWDRRVSGSEFHWDTMFGAMGLAVVIAGMGLVLFFSQRRTWHESESRVSFVNRVSHELGTPLTNMTLNLELASRSLRSKPELAGQRLEKVREEVSRLGRMVTNVLTHSKKGREGIQSRRVTCDPDLVISGVIEQFRPALERREIEVEWKPVGAGEMLVDADSLSQVVWNLISNVEKYASSGKWLGVSVEIDGEDLKVRVCDRGEGIAKGKRGRVFNPFERLQDTASEGVSGTGLGLSISRDLAAAMGGELDLVEDPEMTIFELTIPMKKR